MNDEVHLELKGFAVSKQFPKVWGLLARDGHRFDTYSVGNTDRPLTDDPLGRVAPWLAKPNFWRLVLSSADPSGPCFILEKDQVSFWFSWREREPAAWLTWLDALLALAPVDTGEVWSRDFETFNVYRHGPHAGWLFICGGAARKRLEAAGVTDFLARRKGGFQRAVKKTLVVGLMASPLDKLTQPRASLTEAGDSLLLDAAEAQAKVDVLSLARAAFRRTLGPLGFKEVKGGTRRELHFKRGLVSVVSRFDLGEPTSELYVSARHQGSSPNSYWSWSLARGPLAKTARLLEQALALYVSQEARFLKNPKRFR